MKSARSRACDISQKVKREVYERDEGNCILCGRPGNPNAHYIPRSDSGLGVPENVVTLCGDCHFDYDQTVQRKALGIQIEEYLREQYPDWNEESLRYKHPLRVG